MKKFKIKEITSMNLKFQGDGGIVVEMDSDKLKLICDKCLKKDICEDECLIYELSVNDFKMDFSE